MSSRHPTMKSRFLRVGWPDHAGVKFRTIWMRVLARHLANLKDKDCGADEGNGLESDDARFSIWMIEP
eukprot:980060-Lingulodinium_polyedra.AAC.1